MKLSDMRRILADRRIELSKSLGQNFLHDGNQLRRIAAAAELQPTDSVLEIGPGLGPLTSLLVEGAGRVLALEKDSRLIPILREQFREQANLEIQQVDALDYLRAHRHWEGWKLVSNLPYSVASPILVEFAQCAQPPARMVVTLQLEVAERVRAASGNADYGVLSLLVQETFEPGALFEIPGSCFFPAPEVASACLTLTRRSPPLLAPGERKVFVQLVKQGFSQRRKMMLKLLRAIFPREPLEQAFAEMSISPKARAQELSLSQFVTLAKKLATLSNR